jgi:ribosome-associated protein
MTETYLDITSRLRIPMHEFSFRFVRSGGPGGQNVNKVNSKAILRWPVLRSPSLPEAIRQRLIARHGRRIDKRGVLTMVSQRYRDQNRNVQDCLERLRVILADAAVAPKKRRPTAPTRSSIAARLQDKVRKARTKESRRAPRLEQES